MAASNNSETKLKTDVSRNVKKRSVVWKYFNFQTISGKVDKSKTVCLHCGAIFNYKSNTSNMMAHLERKHWGIIHKQVSENKPTPDVKKATGTSVSIGSSSTQIFL